ncbi:hypothetical protein evm_011677 [Chilo suppressalis]|nr:hypothetical protein evm_011677 [Chilo suppressalis]
MSKIVNSEGVKPGCIYRIALENFVTYKQVELYPSTSLNLIIGPNGTGKSTFVCAIILGLCGKTSVIGRAKKISDYVRSGCQSATIEIELYQQPGERNIIITRTFNLKDASTWSIDHKAVREKQVLELIASMNIQGSFLAMSFPIWLKVLIDAMQQRKQIEQQIEICEKKKLWLEYQDLKDKVTEYINDKKDAVRIVNTHKSKVEPLEKVIDGAKKGIGKLEQQKLSSTREIHTLKDRAKEITRSVTEHEYKIKEIESSYQEKLDRYRNRERELTEAKAKLEKLITDRTKLVEKVGDENQVKMELAELHKPIMRTNAALDNLKKQKLEVQYDLENNITPQIRLYENKIRQLQDIDVKRLEVLRSYSEDTYKAVMWLRENREMFEEPVYEPMMLERIHVQQLCYLGFYAYLIDTISAPDAILRYMCKQYNVHRIPIGNDHTYNNSGKVPANITYFFTENHRFTVRVSAYSGAKSSSIIEIRPARIMANTVDIDQLENYNQQLAKFEQTAQSHRAKIQDFDTKLATLEVNLNEFNMRRKKINDGVERVRTICAQIRVQTKKVQDIENEPSFNIEQEKNRSRRKQKDCVMKQCKLHQELNEVVRSIQGKILNGDMFKVKLEFSRKAIVQQESELRELKSELHSAQSTLENIENHLTRAKSTAKQKLLEAKRSCDDKLPQDPGFPYREDFQVLPSDINALQEHCYELQTRIDCMDKGDEQVIKEYEEREKTIAQLKKEVSSSSDSNKQLDNKMKALSSKWLPPLERLLRDIDKSFGDMFAKLGCAGEIKLDKGGSDEDYDKYGVSILVRFRASEQLQQLTRHAQSGGERALSTALYLMALQRLTTVPFRCVDEINQGMDPVNERKMFQLLVRVTTECDNAQYFLLTPKLLTNLEYNDKIMVHTIMNGRNIMNYRKWKHHKFVERAHAYRNSQC